MPFLNYFIESNIFTLFEKKIVENIFNAFVLLFSIILDIFRNGTNDINDGLCSIPLTFLEHFARIVDSVKLIKIAFDISNPPVERKYVLPFFVFRRKILPLCQIFLNNLLQHMRCWSHKHELIEGHLKQEKKKRKPSCIRDSLEFCYCNSNCNDQFERINGHI